MTVASTFWIGTWLGIRVGGYRKAAKLGYPTPVRRCLTACQTSLTHNQYADSAHLEKADADHKKALYLFNCAQRSHGNFNENHTSVVVAMLIAGLRYPVATAVMGLGWSLGRIVYAVGYTSTEKTNGSGRMLGSFFWLFQFGLFGMASYCGYKLAF